MSRPLQRAHEDILYRLLRGSTLWKIGNGRAVWYRFAGTDRTPGGDSVRELLSMGLAEEWPNGRVVLTREGETEARIATRTMR